MTELKPWDESLSGNLKGKTKEILSNLFSRRKAQPAEEEYYKKGFEPLSEAEIEFQKRMEENPKLYGMYGTSGQLAPWRWTHEKLSATSDLPSEIAKSKKEEAETKKAGLPYLALPGLYDPKFATPNYDPSQLEDIRKKWEGTQIQSPLIGQLLGSAFGTKSMYGPLRGYQPVQAEMEKQAQDRMGTEAQRELAIRKELEERGIKKKDYETEMRNWMEKEKYKTSVEEKQAAQKWNRDMKLLEIKLASKNEDPDKTKFFIRTLNNAIETGVTGKKTLNVPLAKQILEMSGLSSGERQTTLNQMQETVAMSNKEAPTQKSSTKEKMIRVKNPINKKSYYIPESEKAVFEAEIREQQAALGK